MPSVFTKIIDGDIPCYKIAEDDLHFAFLDINPLTQGHTLVVPKQETDYIFDLEDNALAALHLFAKKVATAIKISVPCVRVGVAVIGLEVPHAHIHLVPFNNMQQINFSNQKLIFTKEEFEEIASKIRKGF
ncbi:MAG: HIT family protein [Opitutaceae bacterium]|nr:HIT family protein [Cytophagales bacterium]